MQKLHCPLFRQIHVVSQPGCPTKGLLRVDGRVLPCALGRSGIGIKRGEGDGVTPLGRFPLLEVMLRTDKVPVRSCPLPHRTIKPQDGWCDAAGDRNYNKPVQLPYPAGHEKLMRDDHLYDIALVMDFNLTCHMSIGGSAIFFHLAHDDYRPTEGCVAISRKHMLWLLPHIGHDTILVVG